MLNAHKIELPRAQTDLGRLLKSYRSVEPTAVWQGSLRSASLPSEEILQDIITNCHSRKVRGETIVCRGVRSIELSFACVGFKEAADAELGRTQELKLRLGFV